MKTLLSPVVPQRSHPALYTPPCALTPTARRAEGKCRILEENYLDTTADLRSGGNKMMKTSLVSGNCPPNRQRASRHGGAHHPCRSIASAKHPTSWHLGSPNTSLHPSSHAMLPPWTTELMLSSHNGVGFVFKAWGKHSPRQSDKPGKISYSP